MLLHFQPMNEVNAQAVVNWRYNAPYDIYNYNPGEAEKDITYLIDPQNTFYSILTEQGQLIGYCSFGMDGQVPGGDYREEALDIGMGIRPDLTGQGNGRCYTEQVLDFARGQFAPRKFRVTIATFNERAQRVWQMLNFRIKQSFQREQDGETFIIMIREV